MTVVAARFRAFPDRVISRWRRDAWATGLLVAVLAAGAGTALLLAVDLWVGLAPAVRSLVRWLPPALALTPVAAAWRRSHTLQSRRRAALLLEEREPGLEHLLTTVLEADLTTPLGTAVVRRAEARLDALRVESAVPYTFGRVAPWAGAAALAVVVTAVASPGGAGAAWERWIHPAAAVEAHGSAARGTTDGIGSTPNGATVPRLTSLAVTVTPPAYTGLPSREVSSDVLLGAFPGSRIDIRVGATLGELVARRVGEGGTRSLAAAPLAGRDAGADGPAWHISWTVAPDDRGVDLTLVPDGGSAQREVADRRVIPVAVLEDRSPEVSLELPDEDMVIATTSGVVRVRARATDDFDVADWDLNWIHSSGSGESFSFEEGRWAWDRVTARGDTAIGELDLDLATTGLGPGDVLHLRAEARDRNDVTGPGVGVSATRLIRVAQPDALDEVTTLIGFPIEREREPVLSQRMIILLTEELLEEAGGADGMDEATFQDRSARIADEQDRLRERVEEAMFIRAAEAEEDPEAPVAPPLDPEPGAPPVLEVPGHDHDGNPILAVNQDLVTAFNAMWEASRLLRQAEPRTSLPHQLVALDRLQAVREGDRVFARGRVTRPPLDLEAARGTGEVDEAAPAGRSGGEPTLDGARWRGDIEAMAAALDELPADSLALRLQDLAARVLAAPDGSLEAAAAVERAARAVVGPRPGEARSLLAAAAAALRPDAAAGGRPPTASPSDALEAAYLASLAQDASAGTEAEAANVPTAPPPRPFVFATARYASGDWDSAPLVPSNLVHSLAQYTNLPVREEGAVVDLSSPELLDHPFVFLTGHLPVRLDEAESEGLRRYVERGGFLFIDDHNHDIDGGFHRSVVSELARIFGSDALQPLPDDHEIYRSFFVFDDGPPITGHELSGWGDGLIHRELYGITINGRLGVLYSNKDYASEWSYHAENKRFLARDNTRFGVNVILYALTR